MNENKNIFQSKLVRNESQNDIIFVSHERLLYDLLQIKK